MKDAHPTDEALRAYGVSSPAERSTAITEHLKVCEACRRRLRGATVVETPGDPRYQPTAAGVPASATRRAEDLAPRLPDYELVRHLGGGGMGAVYLYRNKLMNRLEALKVVASHLTQNQDVMDRFQREIQSAASLRHQNIVTAYSVLRWEGGLILAMEFVDGIDLASYVQRRGPLPVAEACFYAFQVARGLRHAHGRGMVHRDLKPANLMIDRSEGKGLVKILDFGLAKIASEGQADSGLTRPGGMLGTPDYVAPEQVRKAQDADIRADIYSLGCTLYHLLSGVPPFEGASDWDILMAHQQAEATPLNKVRGDVPADLAEVLARMMRKDPADRFQTPAEVAEALLPFFKGGVAAPGVSPGGSGPGSPDHRRTMIETPVPDRPVGPAAPSRRPTLVEGVAGRRGTLLETGEPLTPGASRKTRQATMLEAGAGIGDEDLELEDEPPEGGRPSWFMPAAVASFAVAAIVLGFVALRMNSHESDAAPSPRTEPVAATPAVATNQPTTPSMPDRSPPPETPSTTTDSPAEKVAEVLAVPIVDPAPLESATKENDSRPDVALAKSRETSRQGVSPPPEAEVEDAHARITPGPDGVVRHEYERVAEAPDAYEGLRVRTPDYLLMATEVYIDDPNRVPGFGTLIIQDVNHRTLCNQLGTSDHGLSFVLDPALANNLNRFRAEFSIPDSIRAGWKIVPTFTVQQVQARGAPQWAGVIQSLDILVKVDPEQVLKGNLDDSFKAVLLDRNGWKRSPTGADEWYNRLGGVKLTQRVKEEYDAWVKKNKRLGQMKASQALFNQLMSESLYNAAQQNRQQQLGQQRLFNSLFRR